MKTRTVRLAAVLVGASAAPGAFGAWGGGGCGCGKAEEAAARAWSPAGFDEIEGRNLRRYPRDRAADFKHMKLEVLVPDMNQPRLSATETLTLEPLGAPMERLELDAKAMTILGVSSPGRTAGFEHDGERLVITLSPALDAGHDADVIIMYELNDPPLGLIWTPEMPEWPGRAAQIHTQGQPEDNSYWFPTHDFPNDRLTSEIIATVPLGYTVSSNGRLESRGRRIVPEEELADFGVRSLRPYDVFHWVQDKSHVTYLVSLVVGKFDVEDVGAGGLSMPVYAPPGRGGDIRPTFGRTPEMAALFGRLFDEPYPWDRYAQVVVWNFGPGGMENTSATTLHDTAIVAPEEHEDCGIEGLISHELGHQWFGDLVTCNSWEHIWLNEGFATYCTALWREHAEGPEAYAAQVRDDFDGTIAGDRVPAPEGVGMCSKVYAEPWDVFRRPANPYGKGASILHMLRVRLGDEAFFRGIALHIDRRKFETAETLDLQRAMEDASGQNLSRFFTQWCTRPGVPRVNVSAAWDAGAGVLRVTAEQTQQIDGDNPAFEFDLPLYVQTETAKGSGSRHVLAMGGRKASLEIPLGKEPLIVAVDPDMAVLAELAVEQPQTRWAAQLSGGPTHAARIQAARGLGKGTETRHAEMLRRIAVSPGEPVSLRVEAVKALEARGSEVDVRSLVTTARDRWEVREAVTNAIAALVEREEFKGRTAMRTSIAAVLGDRAQRDESTRVRSAAVRGLGKMKAVEYVPVVLAALEASSQHDQVRQAAIGALAELEPPEALVQAVRFSREGFSSRTRAVALGAVGRLAHQNPELAHATLAAGLRDRVYRVRRAAADGLIAWGDQRGVADLESLASAQRTRELKAQVEAWVGQLKAKSAAPVEPAPAPALTGG